MHNSYDGIRHVVQNLTGRARSASLFSGFESGMLSAVPNGNIRVGGCHVLCHGWAGGMFVCACGKMLYLNVASNMA